MTVPPDLEPIRARAELVRRYVDEMGWGANSLVAGSQADVPALIAEIERLTEILGAPCECGHFRAEHMLADSGVKMRDGCRVCEQANRYRFCAKFAVPVPGPNPKDTT